MHVRVHCYIQICEHKLVLWEEKLLTGEDELAVREKDVALDVPVSSRRVSPSAPPFASCACSNLDVLEVRVVGVADVLVVVVVVLLSWMLLQREHSACPATESESRTGASSQGGPELCKFPANPGQMLS